MLTKKKIEKVWDGELIAWTIVGGIFFIYLLLSVVIDRINGVIH